MLPDIYICQLQYPRFLFNLGLLSHTLHLFDHEVATQLGPAHRLRCGNIKGSDH